MDSSSLNALIDELSKAEGPSRELDAAIACAAWPQLYRPSAVPGNVLLIDERGNVAGADRANLYTSSIDAALTLVPEGWRLLHAGQSSKSWFWGIGCNAGHPDSTKDEKGTWYARDETGEAPSLALAICIACLKARA